MALEAGLMCVIKNKFTTKKEALAVLSPITRADN